MEYFARINVQFTCATILHYRHFEIELLCIYSLTEYIYLYDFSAYSKTKKNEIEMIYINESTSQAGNI